ncbi:MAG: mechanosensitive ion channel [Candidatus Borkfalkiaceae bacterium]|nr:mechanosensitive ion channel [Clostridia bacterium]MDY6222817.1 mechanosensitive ion channel [Christensenellaceae bacterium]
MDWQNIWNTIQNWLTSTGIKILVALLLIVVSFAIINKIAKQIEKKGKKLEESKHVDKTVYRTLSNVLKVGLKVLVLLSAVAYLGIDTGAITALLASLGVGVGLAVNGTLSNLAGGILLLFTRPFKDGDYISANGYEGFVEDIFICNTKIRTNDNKVVYLPNGKLSTGEIVNFTENQTRRVDLTYSIAYSDDFEKAAEIVKQVAAANPKILKDPAPKAHITAHSASSIDLFCPVWCNKEDYWDVLFYMNEQVKKAFDENGITIPFGQLDVHVKND